MSEWFPRPGSALDIRCLGPSGELDAEQLCALLQSAEAVEWRDKVGVTSPGDGSAKASTRLLCIHGWVFKTDTSTVGEDPGVLGRSLARPLRIATRVALWHPDKRWFLLREQGSERWWPVSVCPRLWSLRSISDWSVFSRAWAEALNFALMRSLQGVGLDLNPSNFGVASVSSYREGEVWYLDDELYTPLEIADLAEAIVGRIPEWPEVEDWCWEEFGVLLRGLLEPVLTRPREWDRLCERARDVLLAPRWHVKRDALLGGIELARARVSEQREQGETADQPHRMAVIADVHGNLPALTAVIASAEDEGVDGWLFLGDAVGYGPFPQQCIERLAALPKLLGVRGNHDHMACFGVDNDSNSMAQASMVYTRGLLGEGEHAWLRSLPVEQLGEGWMAVHGAPIDPQRFYAYVYGMSCHRNLEHLRAGERPLCFHGHTHVPMVYRSTAEQELETIRPEHRTRVSLREATAALVNPGSVGQPRDGDVRAAYAIWDRDLEVVEFVRVEYDLAPVIAELQAAGLPDDLALRLELGR